jgi:CRISPR/Cas system CSM-associated protein Csm5 (group 7 of RAMP superfamily)
MLTTILNRDINNNPLGINPNKPSILDKFVITDSDYIDANNFVVDIADRPPSINIMMLDSGVEFTSKIRKMGNLSIQDLRNKLQTYSFSQMKKAEQFVNKFKDMEKIPKGATAYYKIIENMLHQINLEENQYLVNLGFGGGSYYKIYTNVEIPKFKSKDKTKRNVEEEAHTTFSVNIENEIYQLGWCTLKIEEE